MSDKNFIHVEIPRNFMNCAVTTDNNFVSDTNDSANWHTLKFPLPKPLGVWEINNVEVKEDKTVVEIVDVEESLKNKLFKPQKTLGGYTKEQWIEMIDDKVVGQPSEDVLNFIKQ